MVLNVVLYNLCDCFQVLCSDSWIEYSWYGINSIMNQDYQIKRFIERF